MVQCSAAHRQCDLPGNAVQLIEGQSANYRVLGHPGPRCAAGGGGKDFRNCRLTKIFRAGEDHFSERGKKYKSGQLWIARKLLRQQMMTML